MELTVKIVSDKIEERKIEVSNGDTYERVLEKLNINPEEVIVLCNGKPVPEDDEVAGEKNAREEITIIRIISNE
jgi:sulfur carrier protein ThiS